MLKRKPATKILATKRPATKRGERGNALFLILIAVALFAALSYAITQSGRGGGTVDKEQALITAASIVQYPATLRTAVTRMIITGTPSQGTAAVNAGTAQTGSNALFDAVGGGASNSPPPSGSAITTWLYLDANDTTKGTAGFGFFVNSVGTNSVGSGREVLAVLAGCGTILTDGNGCSAANAVSLTRTQCEQINKGLGQASPFTPSTVLGAVAVWHANAVGTFTAGGAANTLVGGAVGAANINATPFSCISNAVGASSVAPYHYYHALVEQ